MPSVRFSKAALDLDIVCLTAYSRNDLMMPDSEQQLVPQNGESRFKLRIAVLVGSGIGTLGWLYTFVYAAQHVTATGEFFAWVLPANATLVYFAFVFPALLLGIFAKGGWLEFAGLMLIITAILVALVLAS